MGRRYTDSNFHELDDIEPGSQKKKSTCCPGSGMSIPIGMSRPDRRENWVPSVTILSFDTLASGDKTVPLAVDPRCEMVVCCPLIEFPNRGMSKCDCLFKKFGRA